MSGPWPDPRLKHLRLVSDDCQEHGDACGADEETLGTQGCHVSVAAMDHSDLYHLVRQSGSSPRHQERSKAPRRFGARDTRLPASPGFLSPEGAASAPRISTRLNSGFVLWIANDCANAASFRGPINPPIDLVSPCREFVSSLLTDAPLKHQ